MPKTKKPGATSLHLLDKLSQSIVARLETVCSKAIARAESSACKQAKACEQTQKKLLTARLNLQKASMLGKAGLQTRSRKRVEELEEQLVSLKEHQAKTLQYLASLKLDTEESMLLAVGVREVGEAARKALSMREAKQNAPKLLPVPS